MTFKGIKHIVSAVLSAALAVTASVTAVQGESSPLAVKPSKELYSNSQTITGKFGGVDSVVLDHTSDSVFGLTGSFEGTSYYEQIDADSQKIYDGILNEYKGGMKNGVTIDLIKYFPEMKFEVTGSIDEEGYFVPDDESQEKMDKVINGYIYPAYLALTADRPDLSWISYGMYMWSYGSRSISITSNNTYIYPVSYVYFALKSENVYGTPDEMTAAVSKAKGIIGTQETWYEQLKAIHDYLCNTIDYNYTALNPPAGYDAGYYQTAYSAFYRIPQDGAGDKNLTVCAGYARSFKILCDEYNIPCIYVVGDGINNSGKGEAHAWNYVKMDDDKWYAVDVTWDDQDNKIYYEYFLAGKDTPGFNKLTFGQSHVSSGIWSSDDSYEFKYPSLASEAYDPEKAEVTTETTTEPVVTTEATTEPVITTEATTEPVITTEATTEPVITTEATTEPVITTEATTEPVITTEATTEPVITTEATTEPVITTEATTEPVITTEATTEPVITTEATTEPVITTEADTEPVVTTEVSVEPIVTTETDTEPVVTTAEITTAPEEASVDTDVNIGEGAPEAEIDMDKDQLIDAVLSDEEKELIKDGTVNISFNIDNVDKTVSDEVKKAVEDYLADLQDGSYELGMYIDISLFKTVNGEKTAVTDTNKPIRITVSVPENILKDGRVFGLVRVHDGKTEFLSDLDTDPDTITVESDKFSTYAIVYNEKVASDPSQDDENKNTGFGFENSLIITMIISAATVFGSAITIYFKSSKSKK